MNNATDINVAQSYQLPLAQKLNLYTADSSKVQGREADGEKNEKADSSERVTISREAYQLKREYSEKKEEARLEYQQERQELKREYQQEKKSLEREFQRKKESLEINVYI